ncbi:MAG: hypothetical protein Q3975_04335 [Oscillospiraceae bacterium]|nr:hypothetical protein [Oscillospiraceae bacterium]
MNFSVLLPVIIAVAAILIVIIARLKNKNKASYDERQTLARYSAFRTSFIFLLFYCLICATLYILDIKWSNIAVQMFIGCILSLSLFIALCILKDAYFSNTPKRNVSSVITFFLFGIMALYYFLSGFAKGNTLFMDGQISTLALWLIFSICLFVLGIIALIKLILDKRRMES